MPIWGDPSSAGQRYEPSNGTEGSCFHAAWCERCERDRDMNGTCHREGREPGPDDWCEILGASFQSGGVKEWIFDAKGQPMCTAFVPVGQALPIPRCENTPDMFGETKTIR
jgi:hypothetical protein